MREIDRRVRRAAARLCATSAAMAQSITDDHFDVLKKSAGTYRSFYVKTGRNEPCTCGSGKKYKRCCGRSE